MDTSTDADSQGLLSLSTPNEDDIQQMLDMPSQDLLALVTGRAVDEQQAQVDQAVGPSPEVQPSTQVNCSNC